MISGRGQEIFFCPVDCIDFDLALDCVTKLVMKWGVIVACRNVWCFKMHDLILQLMEKYFSKCVTFYVKKCSYNIDTA